VVDLAEPAHLVAPQLLGATIISLVGDMPVVLRVSEVEAYGGMGEDPGSHAHRGPTPRTQVMFGQPGAAYVYFTYGMHWCLNVVTGPPGAAGAVLIRAGEVVNGLEIARQRRPKARSDHELAKGPARLCAALGVDGSINGIDLLDPQSAVRIELPQSPVEEFGVSARTGVGGLGSGTPWRFFLLDDPTVSPYRAAVRRA